MPVLGREVAAAQGAKSGARLGNLHAHIGWSEYLRWRDGAAVDPAAHYQLAVAADPANPYANAMWAHNGLLRREATPEVVAQRFETALASGRETAYVRGLQTTLVEIQGDQLVPVLRSVAEGRKRGEPAPRGAARLYRRWCEWAVMAANARMPLLNALAADDAIATIAWLQPLESLRPEQHHLWHLCGSAYLVHAGRHAQADDIIKRTLASMGKAHEGGSDERWAKEQLARFKPAK